MGASSSRPARKCKIAKGPRVLCYGDSLTAGFLTHSPFTHEYAPWAPVLADAIGVPCDHVGASGWTTAQMVANVADGGNDACGLYRLGLRKALRAQCYSTVIIMAGTNDLGTAPAEKITQNLLALHAECHAAGCTTIAITIPQGRQLGPWTAGTRIAFADERRRSVNAALADFARARQKKCLFIAMDEAVPWSSDSTDWEPDGLHMSASGYARFGQALAPKVKEFVKLKPVRRHSKDLNRSL